MKIPAPPAPTPDEKFDTKMRDITSRYYQEEDRVRHDRVTFKSYMTKFEEYPIVMIETDDYNRLRGAYDIDLNAMFAEMCKKRGWVHISITGDWRKQYMIVPRNRRTPKLVASLQLIANNAKGGVALTIKERSWTFMFTADAKPMLEAFIEQCKSDDLYQLILGFGPGPNGAFTE